MNAHAHLLIGDSPMRFEEFLLLFGEDEDFELINGVIVERISAQLDHERLFAWLMAVLVLYVEHHVLGIVLGSRTVVKVGEFRARMPDLLFVRAERLHIVQQRAVYGAPDLVIEIISAGDRCSDVVEREADYRALGVDEIWLIDRPGGRLRLLQREGEEYRVAERTEGIVQSRVLNGLQMDVRWLLSEERPPVHEILRGLET